MRRLKIILQKILRKPILWVDRKYSSRPVKEQVFQSLNKLYKKILEGETKKGIIYKAITATDKFIIFSDQHKGNKNGADDFWAAENNYIQALKYYHQKKYRLIALGDSEELWENNLWQVKKSNKKNFAQEKAFLEKNRFIKIFGNHDLFWGNDPLAAWHLKQIYGIKCAIYEGVILQFNINNKPIHIVCTHGHQGDAQSDGNWFSKFFVSYIWAPLQSYLAINPNTISTNQSLKTLHNEIMYEWTLEQKNLLLITGHTHQPVFASLTMLERLYKDLLLARLNQNEQLVAQVEEEILKRKQEYLSVSPDYLSLKPSYFNTGCCCFSDGDITGIEIEGGIIRLIKWHQKQPHIANRVVLEEMKLTDIANAL